MHFWKAAFIESSCSSFTWWPSFRVMTKYRLKVLRSSECNMLYISCMYIHWIDWINNKLCKIGNCALTVLYKNTITLCKKSNLINRIMLARLTMCFVLMLNYICSRNLSVSVKHENNHCQNELLILRHFWDTVFVFPFFATFNIHSEPKFITLFELTFHNKD